MIDPDGIQIQRGNLPSNISIEQVPEFESTIYNLEDDKDYAHYIKDCERQIRQSFEYQQFIRFIRNNFNMNRCAFLADVSNEETFDIKIQIHHYPFSLHDIVEIVMRKRQFYHESLDLQMVAKECMQLHYKCLIGLIPLSETAHELAHSSRLFIPSNKVFGRYQLFVDYYKPFCEPEQLDTLERIEKYTNEHTEINDTTILDQNQVSFDIKDQGYMLPDLNTVSNDMKYQLEMIKENNFLLPTAKEMQELTDDRNSQDECIIFHKDRVVINIPHNVEYKCAIKKKQS